MWVTLAAGMRCPSCGTQNEPDSRFCGGCGARLSAGQSRVAPTQKVTTGANEAQPRAHNVTPAPVSLPGVPTVIPPTPIPGGAAPVTIQQRPSAPQRVSAPQSTPQPGSVPPGPPSGPLAAPLGSEPGRVPNSVRNVPVPIPGTGMQGGVPISAGAPVTPVAPRIGRPSSGRAAAAPHAQGRRLGLIVGVIVVDLGLAIAGGWMLSEGLAAGEAPAQPQQPPPQQQQPAKPAADPAPASNASAQRDEAPGHTSDTVAAGGGPSSVAAGPPSAPAAASGSADAAGAAPADDRPAARPAQPQGRKKPAKKPPRSGVTGGAGPKGNPIDPYGEPDPLPPEQPPPPPPPFPGPP